LVGKAFYLIFFIFGVYPLGSQSLYLEVLGKGIVNSINYEQPLTKNPFGLNIQVGVGFAPSSLITIPVTIAGILGQKSHHLEVGIGGTVISGNLSKDNDSFGPEIFAHVVLYYRYQKPDGRMLFKIGLTPFIGSEFPTGFWFGTGIGYVFRN
jgi:hypothetical protein